MIETIGKVKIDLEFYPGEDLYCDGDVENDLLEAVKASDSNDYRLVIEEKNNWPFLYHLSKQRGNIISWFPMNKNTKVLEIGSGCGAITSCIADKCGEITCVDLSKKRSLINAYRNKESDNITIKLGNFQDVEPSLDTDYDLILLIGVFEYAAAYINSKNPYTEFLDIIKKHMKDSGNIVIAIENRMGLKYLAGCKEDHLGNYFSGIENYPNGGVVRTFTRPALEKIFKASNISEYDFYYPYPDYKFMHTLYSDDRLPVKGELTTNFRNFDRDRLLLFDEKNAFDSIIDDGTFSLFSNSYLAVIGKKPEIIYSKLSNDRALSHAIRTDIIKNNAGKKVVKYADNNMAKDHIKSINKAYHLLADRYKDSELIITKADFSEDSISFDYVAGVTLEEKLDALLFDLDEFKKLVFDYYKRISFNEDSDVTDYDLIFPNIIIDNDNNWNVIDYEWTYKEKIPSIEILARAIYCYRLGSEKRKEIINESVLKEIFEKLSDENKAFSYEEQKLYEKEISFQKKVTDGTKSLSEIRDAIHFEILPLTNAIERINNEKLVRRQQVYFDRGKGFSEADSYYIDAEDISEFSITIKLSNDMVNVRFDPLMKACMIKDMEAYILRNDNSKLEFNYKKLLHNGTNMSDNTIAFNHNDPNVTFALKHFKHYKYQAGDNLIINYKKLL